MVFLREYLIRAPLIGYAFFVIVEPAERISHNPPVISRAQLILGDTGAFIINMSWAILPIVSAGIVHFLLRKLSALSKARQS